MFIVFLFVFCFVCFVCVLFVDEMLVIRVFVEMLKSVVCVVVVVFNGEISGCGSGVVWYIDDVYVYIVMNVYCVVKGNENEKLVVMFASGVAAVLDKDVLYFVNRSIDIGFLKVFIGSFGVDVFVVVKIGMSDNLCVG